MRRAAVIAVLLVALSAAAPAQASRPRTAGLQVALRAEGLYRGPIDGVAGPRTAAALRAFQRREGLTVDGVAGPRTRRALGRLGRPLLGRRVLRRGSVGWDVSVLQFHLRERGARPGRPDGVFGRRTEAALRRFQRRARLAADGVVGPATIAALARTRASAAPRRAPRRYRVRPGDTLTGVAMRHRTTVAALARANRLDAAGVLLEGIVLRVPAARSPRRKPTDVRGYLDYWSARYGVDARLVRAVAWQESGFQPAVVSLAGARGVMQVTASTWEYVETMLIRRRIPRTVEGNVRIGVAFLRHLLRYFRGNERLAVGAYYQGAHSVRRRGLLPETRRYVANVLALRTRIT